MSFANEDFPDPVGPAQPAARFSEQFHDTASDSRMEETMAEPSAHTATAHSAEVISLDTMRSAMVANFEQDDLNVPAFLRKRGEVM